MTDHMHNAPTGAVECFSLASAGDRLKVSYRRLALVTQQAHIDALGRDDGETLIVSCDWLIWQQLACWGRDAVYFEYGLLGWQEQEKLNSGLYNHANDWVHDSAGDMTMFRGVSLGKLFSAEVTMIMMNYYRLDRSLRSLIGRFQPEELHFFDFMNEINVMDTDTRKLLVAGICSELGVTFAGRVDAHSSHILEKGRIYVGTKANPVKELLMSIYTRALATVTALRCLFKCRHNRVLVLVNSNMLAPLIDGFGGGALTPLFIGRTVPKRPSTLWRCLKAGVILARMERASVSDADRGAVRKIAAAIKRVSSSSRTDTPPIVRSYIEKQILDSGRLAEAAATVRAVERFLDRHSPHRIVVDGVRNAPHRTFVEVGRLRGAEVDYIWHGPMTPLATRMDALSGDAWAKPLVTRCLSWGDANDQWLDAVDARQPRVRVGSPLADNYRNAAATASPATSNALILQYTPQVEDLRGLNSNALHYFVTLVRRLNGIGYRNVIMKLHPGPGRWPVSYYEGVKAHFGLDCRVLKTAPFLELLDWADIVIGPVCTGAMLEAFAARKPYFAFLIPPHSMNMSFYGGFPTFASADELTLALARKFNPNGLDLLNAFYSFDQFASTTKRFWEVVGEDTSAGSRNSNAGFTET